MFRLLSDFASILVLAVIALGAIGCTRHVVRTVYPQPAPVNRVLVPAPIPPMGLPSH